jgi:metal-sulfur cluster biosynthetic enzyme
MRRAKIESQKQKLQDAVEKYDLNYIEELLVRGCYSVLDVPVEHIAQMCKASRISEEEVRAHATEIGVDKKLTIDMVWNIVKFVQFMYLVEKLKIVEFGTGIAGRSVLGYTSIKIKMHVEWEGIICSICGFRNYFQAFSTLYEMMLKFGFGMSREGKLPEHAVKGTSTQNKTNALLFCDTLSFEEDKLASNLKRYTNQQTKPKETSDGINLLALATVAAKELK